MDSKEIKKLADLARIDMSEEELEGLAKDFQSILAYVGQVGEISENVLSEDKKPEDYFTRNVVREDVITNDSKDRVEKILANVPETEDRFIKVKKIM